MQANMNADVFDFLSFHAEFVWYYNQIPSDTLRITKCIWSFSKHRAVITFYFIAIPNSTNSFYLSFCRSCGTCFMQQSVGQTRWKSINRFRYNLARFCSCTHAFYYVPKAWTVSCVFFLFFTYYRYFLFLLFE